MLLPPDTDRRALLRHAMWLAAAAAVPQGAGALGSAVARPSLDPERMALLSAVADTIIPRTDTPGAVDVGVPKLLDGMLRDWASPTRRNQILASLDKVGKLTPAGGGGPFVALTPAERNAVLTVHDKAALKPTTSDAAAAGPLKAAPVVVDPQYGRPKQEATAGDPPGVRAEAAPAEKKKKPVGLNALMAEPEVVDVGYAKLKELIVVLYYYSEPALTQELRYEHAPGQWVPSIPIRPDTRPWGGAGYI